MRYITYFRVSTARQNKSGLGLDAQRVAVSTFLAGSSASVLGEFVEVESGGNNDRAQLAAAFQACRLFGAKLLIAKLDRLSRDASFLMGLDKAGIQFVAADMPEANEMVVGIMAVMAQAERKMIGARTTAALAAAKARGTKLGGWRQDANGNALSKAPTAEHVALSVKARQEKAEQRARAVCPIISELQAAGITSLRAIAGALADRGVPAARGGTTWTASGVARVMTAVAAPRKGL